MTDTDPKPELDRAGEARVLGTLCAEANAARRLKLELRLAGGSDSHRTPRRLVVNQ